MSETAEADRTAPASPQLRVPHKPTVAMLAAAAVEADVSVETAWRVWRAMIAAVEERPADPPDA